jgi:tetratricopeptide (TPR) repeat protein
VWVGATAPLHEAGPSWLTLSLDPIATRIEVLRGLTYVGAFAVSASVAIRRGGAQFLAASIVVTAVVLGVSAVLHPALGAHRVFGIYAPVEGISARHIAPLLNPNHLAAYLNLGLFLGLGLALDERAPQFRTLGIAAVALLAPIQVWVASRGGLAATLFGGLCFLLVRRGSRRHVSIARLLPALAVIAGTAMIVLGSSEDAATELNTTDISKIRLALSALPLASRYWLWGVGRGAFEVAFPAIQHDPRLGYMNCKSPENLPVQWVTEWGVPATIVALIALGVALRPKAGGFDDPKQAGAWTAIVVTALHNLVDFSSEVPAIGIAVAASAAIVTARRRGTTKTADAPCLRRANRWGLAGATALSIGVVLCGIDHELDADKADLRKRAMSLADRTSFQQIIRAALARHPSEPYIPLVGGMEAAARGASAMPWVERTLTLSPIFAPAHYVIAQQLSSLAPSQARLEYRLAISEKGMGFSELSFGRDVLPRVAPLVGGFDDAIELAPDSPDSRASILGELATAIRGRLPATCKRLDTTIHDLTPSALAPYWRAVEDALLDLREADGAPWCAGASCANAGLDAANELVTRLPGECAPLVARARLRLARGDGHSALVQLREAAQTSVDAPKCWGGLAELSVACGEDVLVDVAEQAMSVGGCGSDTECADRFVWLAGIEESRKNYRNALGYYQRAHARQPRLDIVVHMAGLAARLDQHAVAVAAYRELAKAQPAELRWRELAEHEEVLAHQAAP